MNADPWQNVASAGKSHVGLSRRHNEDRFLDQRKAGLWAVADGMGGLSRGDRASAAVVDSLAALSLPDRLDDAEAMVCNAIVAANRRLRSNTDGGPSGSTVVALLMRGPRYSCIWAGDSRLYRLSDAGIERLTKDHSVVQQLVDAGVISQAQARTHPLSNRITRAVGTEDQLELEILRGKLRPGDRFLLCSDGLHGMVVEEEIERILFDDTAEVTGNRLIDAALAGGGRDNVSVVVVDIAVESDLDTTLVGG